jgi:hypothetical protein
MSQPLQALPCEGMISIHGTCDGSAPKPGVISPPYPFPPGYTGGRATLIASMRVLRSRESRLIDRQAGYEGRGIAIQQIKDSW